MAIDTYAAERDYLAAHPELLEAAAGPAVAEVLLAVPEDEAGRYAALRQAAQHDSADAAYRPLLLTTLAREFAGADPGRQRALLADRADDLLTGTVPTRSTSWPRRKTSRLSRRSGPLRCSAWPGLATVRVAEDLSGYVAGLRRGGYGRRGGAELAERCHVVADGAVAAAVAAVAELGVQLADAGAALVPPLVQVGLVIIEHRRPAVLDLGEQLISAAGPVEPADGLLGQPALAHDRLDAQALQDRRQGLSGLALHHPV